MSDLFFLGVECVSTLQSANGTDFVCNAHVLRNGMIFKGVGIGQNMQNACNSAKSMAMANAVNAHQAMQPEAKNSFSTNQHFASHTRDRFNGGGSKPATQRQVDLVEKLARENMRNGAEVANATFGKQLGELTGSQADSLIKQLKGAK